MKEYICKEDLIDYINEGLNTSKFGHDGVEIMAEIEYMPAADVVEVVHEDEGRWQVMEEHACKEELKPCPFCGSNVKLTNDDDEYFWITCNSCEISTKVFMTREEVVETWNKRVRYGRMH